MSIDKEHKTWVEFYTNNFRENGLTFPSIDLFFTQRGDVLAQTTAAVTVLTSTVNHTLKKSAFEEIHVIVPAENDIKQEQLVKYITSSSFSSKKVYLWRINHFTVHSIIEQLKRCPYHSAVIILNAALYVTDETKLDPIKYNSNFTLSKDLWLPHLHYLIKEIEEINAHVKCYVIVDAGEAYPNRSELNDCFMSFQTLAIIVDQELANKSKIFSENLEVWKIMLEEGKIGSALQGVADMPSEFDADKPHLRIQVLHVAGMTAHALDEIDQLNINGASIEVILKIARIAAEAGGVAKSYELLASIVPQLKSFSNFEAAWTIANMLGINSLQNKVAEKYQARYPNQSTQFRHNIHNLILKGEFAQAILTAETSDISHGMRVALNFCHEYLEKPNHPNHLQAASSLNPLNSWADIAFNWIVNDAIRKHLLIHAFELVFGSAKPRGIESINEHAFRIIRKIMLAINSNGTWPIAEKDLHAALWTLVSYAAERPAQQSYRFEIEELLSHQMAGTNGLVFLVHRMLHATTPVIVIKPSQEPSEVDNAAFKVALDEIRELIEKEGMVIAGRLKLPAGSLTSIQADGIIEVCRYALKDDDFSLNNTLLWLSILSIAVPYSTQPNCDLELYRQAAGRFAISAYPQNARNLIDMVLISAQTDDLARRREAWFVCADIYSRLRQTNQAFVAAVCGLSTNAVITPECALLETDVCTRLLRDSGFYEPAFFYHDRSKELLIQLNQFESQAVIHEFVGFTIEFASLIRGKIEKNRFIDLINRVCSNAQQVLNHNLPPQPMALLLGQAIKIAKKEHITLPLEAEEICQLLSTKLKDYSATLYQQIATEAPSAKGLLKLLQSTEPARYARDNAFDTSVVAIAARRLLGSFQLDASDSIFALEILCDRSISLPGWKTTAKPLPQVATTTETSKYALDLSVRGIDIVLIGLDEQGNSYAVICRQGQLLPLKLKHKFSSSGFLEWKKHYPYLYGIDEETPNLFYTSTEGLNFPFDIQRSTVIIATNILQPLPPSLYRVGEEFVGKLHPVFTAPSLSWLFLASSSPHLTDKRLTAWISIATNQGQTLVMAKERLDETIERYGIKLDIGEKLPDTFWGAEMSLVVAHGSVLPEGKYFQRVSDEGTLKVTTEEFARAFKNVGLIVLFVCSAGRIDKSPDGETTYGLARELLQQGCSAVVASPWPLDSRVPYHWFPAFMDAWSSGKNIADATFIANNYVAENFSSDLRNCLAMTVFGDGLRLMQR